MVNGPELKPPVGHSDRPSPDKSLNLKLKCGPCSCHAGWSLDSEASKRSISDRQWPQEPFLCVRPTHAAKIARVMHVLIGCRNTT